MLVMVASAPDGSSQTRPTRLSPQEAGLDASALFRAHAKFVAAFLQRLGIRAQECNDLVQEVFLIVHRKGGYRPGAAQPTTWLAGLALGVARNHRRRKARLTSFDLTAVGPQESAADPERSLYARESLDLVRRALDQLPEDQRVVIMLHELDGQSLVSIAAGLGAPTGTIYARLHRGRKAFRRAYAALSNETSPEGGRP